MPTADAAGPDPQCDEPDRSEQRLDDAVLAVRAVHRGEHDRRRIEGGEPLQGRGRAPGPSAPRRGGSWNVSSGSAGSVAASGSDHQPPARSMSQALTSWSRARRPAAIARPETSETSCSADGPPSSTATRVGREAHAGSTGPCQSPTNATS